MVHVIKVFLKEENSIAWEIRRIAVGSDVMSKYELLYEKIKDLFPRLKNKFFELAWKDADGDLIVMSSDDELAQALANAEDGFLKLYINLLGDKHNSNENIPNAPPVPDEVHPRAMCDGCDRNIQGYRYKCLQCKDYDLCSSCNAANKHPSHDMIKLVRPTYVPREWVFLGARKMWRSMFGCTPRGFHEAMGKVHGHHKRDKCEDSKKEKPEATASDKWQEVFANAWKGGFLPADKVFQDSIGNFLKMAGIEVKVGKCPFDKEYTGDGETSDDACCEPSEGSEKSSAGKSDDKEKNTKEPEGESVKDACMEAANISGINELKLDDKTDANENELKESPSNSVIGGLFPVANKTEKEMCSQNGNEMESSNCADGWTLLNKEDASKKMSPSESSTSIPVEGVPFTSIPVEGVPSTSNPKEVPSPSNPKEEVIVNRPDMKKKEEDQRTPCDPKIDNALAKMFAMGFSNEGGWLEKLLITKEGNINEALDALYPNTQRH